MATACATQYEQPSVAGEYLSGRFAAQFNEIDAAAGAFAAAADAADDPAIVRRAFFYHLAAGDLPAASSLAKRLVGRAPEDDDDLPRLTLAIAALDAGDYRGARARLRDPFQESILQSIAHLVDVWIEAEVSGPDNAIRLLENADAVVFAGFNATHKALLAEKARRYDLAREAHQVSVLGLGGPVGRAAYGAFLERAAARGEDGAADNARDFYTLLMNEPGPMRRLAEAGLARLDRGAASKAYASVGARQGAAIALYTFGGGLLEQTAIERDRAEAAGFNVGEPRYNLPLALAQLALELDPNLVDAKRLVSAIYALYGDADSAIATLADIPPTSHQFVQARVDVATALARDKRPDEAIAVLRRTIAAARDADEARYALAALLSTEDRHIEAAEAITPTIAALGEDPPDDAWRYYIIRGGAYLEGDRWADAEVDLKRAYELAPEEATTLNYLGYSWAERGVNLDEAFDLIEKAVALAPDSGAVTDSLGWAHYQLGQYEEAVIHLEKAAAMEPADPTITDHLGDAYWRLGRRREAIYQWRRALELEPSDRQRNALEDKLQQGLPALAEDERSRVGPSRDVASEERIEAAAQ